MHCFVYNHIKTRNARSFEFFLRFKVTDLESFDVPVLGWVTQGTRCSLALSTGPRKCRVPTQLMSLCNKPCRKFGGGRWRNAVGADLRATAQSSAKKLIGLSTSLFAMTVKTHGITRWGVALRCNTVYWNPAFGCRSRAALGYSTTIVRRWPKGTSGSCIAEFYEPYSSTTTIIIEVRWWWGWWGYDARERWEA